MTADGMVGPAVARQPTMGGFDALYEAEYAAMVRVAFLLLDSESQAEEAVHDAFAKVYERWAKLTNPGGYLRTCVVNRCRDLQRRRRVQRRHDEQARRAGGDAEPSSELGADELTDALAQLPIRQRAAVVLRFYDGRSEAEIAEALGVAPGTVKSLVSRALAQLREVIEP